MALCREHLHGEFLRVVWATSRSASRRPFACLVFLFFSCGSEAALLAVSRVLCIFYVSRSVTKSPVEAWVWVQLGEYAFGFLGGQYQASGKGAGTQDDNASTARCNLAMGLILFWAVLFCYCVFLSFWCLAFSVSPYNYIFPSSRACHPVSSAVCLDVISLRHLSTPLYGNTYSESSGRLPWPSFGPKVGWQGFNSVYSWSLHGPDGRNIRLLFRQGVDLTSHPLDSVRHHGIQQQWKNNIKRKKRNKHGGQGPRAPFPSHQVMAGETFKCITGTRRV